MADTPSRSSLPESSTAEPTLGGGFEGDPDEPHVAIYPGPASSLSHFYDLVDGKPEPIPVSEFTRWSNTAAFPQIPTRPAFRVWRKIKQQPRFDGADLPSQQSLSPPRPPPPPDGDSDQFKAISTRPPTGIGSSKTMALPPGRRVPRHSRPGEVHERRWRFRPVREFDATRDRSRFMNDDGIAAQGVQDRRV